VRAELVDVLTRTRLMDALVEDGLNVALPLCASSVDILAYNNQPSSSCHIVSVPIRVKLINRLALPQDFETELPDGLLAVLMCGNDPTEQPRTYALTPSELTFIKMVGLIAQASTAGTSASLRAALEPFAMTRGQWRRKIKAMLQS
jgi:hypothetical protein